MPHREREDLPSPDSPGGRKRVVIESVTPEVDGGRFPAKRVVGDEVVVEADVFADGHDELRAHLLHRGEEEDGWREAPMEPLGNDRWRGRFVVDDPGRYRYTVEGWVDPFRSWRRALAKRVAAGQELSTPLRVGAGVVEAAAERAGDDDAPRLRAWARRLRDAADEAPGGADGRGLGALGEAVDGELAELVDRHPPREHATRYPRELALRVDRERARFSSWYEFFPRSAKPGSGEHASFADCEAHLDYVAEMGFDVVYLPPIHPIGRTNRKGPNNAPEAGLDDPGSPWAIGAEDGGHTAIHPELGTPEDFQAFVDAARERGLEVALDLAFQCSPDHPWVREHPEWFRHRPDGTIQFAENPPKKYEDIYPLDFDTEAWPSLWTELRDVIAFWVEEGVRIFRVDNPHTKPFAFWEWAIDEIRSEHPDVVFLSEAFTRPKIMYRLAKLGFTQSYTYFAWRNAKHEIEEYVRELAHTDVGEYFRPSFWPNTPDILTEYLQTGGRPAFVIRHVLAATLTPSYGIYGPAFELCWSTPREPGSEEYLHSEKYEIREWELDVDDSLKEHIRRVNRIRRENPALRRFRNIRFHDVDDPEILAYSKSSPDGENTILVVVNLDPHHTRSGWVDVDVGALGLGDDESYRVEDLLGGTGHLWHGRQNYVELNPRVVPAHIFRVARRARTEEDFDYFA